MSRLQLSFLAAGRPAPGGSKRHGVVTRKVGGKRVPVLGPGGMPKTFVTDMSGKAGKDWRKTVQKAAAEAMGTAGLDPIEVEVTLGAYFYMPRPKAHFRTGRFASDLRNDAPRHHVQAPDLTKLLRALEDALTGIVWRDDAQVVSQGATKGWDGPRSPAGVLVVVTWDPGPDSLALMEASRAT